MNVDEDQVNVGRCREAGKKRMDAGPSEDFMMFDTLTSQVGSPNPPKRFFAQDFP